MSTFTITEWINTTPDVIFPKLYAEKYAKQIMPNISVYQILGDGPVGVGTEIQETRTVNGREASNVIVVSAFEPNRVYAATSEQMGIKATYTYRLSAENNGTRVDLVADVNAKSWRKLFLPMLVGFMKKEDGDHLARLKEVVEAELAVAA